MALTPEILAALSAPFAVEEHEFRPKGQNKEKTKQQWLVYIDQVPLIERLNKLTPDYGWEVIMYTEREKYATCHGRLTLCDVSRDGIGGNSPNFDGADADEDTVKGAETDALKRAAVKFGIGLYLREAPAIWVDINANEKDWKRREVAVKVFAEWYAQHYGGKPKLGSGAANGKPRRIPEPTASVTGAGLNGGSKSTPKVTDTVDVNAVECEKVSQTWVYRFYDSTLQNPPKYPVFNVGAFKAAGIDPAAWRDESAKKVTVLEWTQLDLIECHSKNGKAYYEIDNIAEAMPL